MISDREMHVVASVEEWNKGLPQAGLKQKYLKMASSPLMFFQGTNHLFWADLRYVDADDPAEANRGTLEDRQPMLNNTFASGCAS